MKDKYRVAIIGCGSIGALKPDKYDAPGTRYPLTHAHAVVDHERFELSSLVDVVHDIAFNAGYKWDCHKYFTKIESAVSFERPDVVVISSPTDTHLNNIGMVLQLMPESKPKLLILEKPFCDDKREAGAALDMLEHFNIPTLINYNRSYLPFMHMFRDEITRPDVKVYSARVLYGRGLYRDGCHAIALFNFLFGKFINVIAIPEVIYDYQEHDPTISAVMKYERCNNVQLVGVDSREFSVFELEVVTNEGKYIFKDNGATCAHYPVMPEPVYGDYPALSQGYRTNETGLQFGLKHLLDHAAAFLDGDTDELMCTPDDAIEVHRVMEDIRLYAKVKGIKDIEEAVL